MSFYSKEYFLNQTSNTFLYKYIFLVILLFIVCYFFIKRNNTKKHMRYRDLLIMIVLMLLFFTGIEISQFNETKNQRSNAQNLVYFIDDVIENNKQITDNVYVNSTYLVDKMVLKNDDDYYLVHMNNDLSSYQLEPTFFLGKNKIRLVEE